MHDTRRLTYYIHAGKIRVSPLAGALLCLAIEPFLHQAGSDNLHFAVVVFDAH